MRVCELGVVFGNDDCHQEVKASLIWVSVIGLMIKEHSWIKPGTDGLPLGASEPAHLRPKPLLQLGAGDAISQQLREQPIKGH